MSFIPSLPRVAGLCAALAASGCVGVCPGTRPSCESSYPAARLALHEGGRWFGPQSVWTDASGQVRGDVEDGSRWAVAALGDRLAVGHPEANRVSLVPAPSSEVFLADVALGAWSDPTLGFATDLAAAPPAEGEPHDLWVGAPGASTYRGEVVRWADAEGSLGDEPVLRIRGGLPGDSFGDTVLPCGDVTGDGRTDWLISATGFSGSATAAAAQLAGAAVLIRSEQAEVAAGDVGIADVGRIWWGAALGDGAGTGLACGDDLTGDGRPDLVVGAPWADDAAGVVYVVSGAASDRDGALSSVMFWRLRGTAPQDWFGAAVATGDFDGDGVADLAVGAPGARDGLGSVLVYDGADIRAKARNIAPRTTIELRDAPGTVHLGEVLAAGRISPDAVDDLVIGVPAWFEPDFGYGLGRAFVFDGRADTASTMVADEDADRIVEAGQAFQRVGRRVVLADVDGDGNDDLLLPTGDRAPP